jgi:predicted nucleic acid-binding protein
MNEVLFGLALFSSKMDMNRSVPIDNYMPWIRFCLSKFEEDTVSNVALKELLFKNFGQDFPRDVLSKLVVRAEKLGFVKKKRRTYVIRRDKVTSDEYITDKNRVISEYESLVASVHTYLKKNYSEQGWTEKKVTQALEAYYDHHGINILLYLHKGNNFPLTERTEITVRPYVYFISKYLKHVGINSSEFKWFTNILTANTITKAYYCIDPKQKFDLSKVDVYVDTSLILYLLGLHKPISSEPTKELLDLLKSSNANLFCFPENYDEVIGVIKIIIDYFDGKLDSEPYGLISKAVQYIQTHKLETTIRLLYANLEKRVADLGIMCDGYKCDDLKQYYNNFSKLTYKLREAYENANDNERYYDDQAETDAKSIYSIVYQRKSKRGHGLKNCVSLFIAQNHTLVSISNKHIKEEFKGVKRYGLNQNSFFPPCIEEREITYLLWLQQPRPLPDLPNKIILADCYAATQPSSKLMELFVNDITKLKNEGEVSEEDYLNYRYSEETKDALMAITHGEISSYSEGTLEEVMNRSREKMILEAENKSKETIGQQSNDILSYKQDKEFINNQIKNEATKETNKIMKNRKIVWLICFVLVATVLFLFSIFVIQNQIMKFITRYIAPLILLILTTLPYWTKINTITECLDKMKNDVYSDQLGIQKEKWIRNPKDNQ